MAREIKTRLSVDGEQAFKRAISDASKSISQMGSNLSLAAAEFKKDGDAMKLMQTRSATLRAEIAQQSQIVKALQGALSDVTQKYGENSKQAEEWQTKLNQAKAKMANLEVELRNNEQGLDRNGKAFQGAGAKAQQFAKDVKDAERTANGINFMAAHTAIQNLSNSLSSVFRTALNVGKRVTSLANSSGQWADELGTLSLQTGLSTDTLQKWAHAAEYAETDVSTITKAFVKLTNPTEKVQQTLKKMGVTLKEVYKVPIEGTNIVDLGVRARDTNEIFWDTVDALGRMKNATDQEAAANELFGKSYQQLMPLVRLGRARWQELEREAADMGLVIGEDGVQALNDYYDSTRRVEEELTALKNSVFAELAPGMKEAADGFTQLVQNFNAWAQSEKGQEALGKLSDAIGSVFSSVTDQDFEDIVGTATGAIEGLTGAFGWFSENGETVRLGLVGLAGALAAMKVSLPVLSFLQLMKTIKWLDVSKGAKSLADAAGAAENETAAGNAASVNAASEAVTKGAANGLTFWLTDEKQEIIDAWKQEGSPTTAGTGKPSFISNLALFKTAKESSEELGTGLWGYWYGKKRVIPEEDLGPLDKSLITTQADQQSEEKFKSPVEIREAAVQDALHAVEELLARAARGEENLDPKQLTELKNQLSPSVPGHADNSLKQKAIEETYHQLYQAINDYDPETGANATLFFDKVLDPLVEKAAENGGIVGDKAKDISDLFRDKWFQSLNDEDWEGSTSGLLNILRDAIDDAVSEEDQTLSSQTQSAGKNASDGLAAGILAQKAKVEAAAAEVAEAAAARIRAALQIQSPSRVMKRLGAFVSQGFAEGIEEASGAVQQAVNRMAGATAARPVAMGYGGTYNNQTYHSSRSIYIDKYNQYSAQDVDSLMEAMESVNRYERQGRGA